MGSAGSTVAGLRVFKVSPGSPAFDAGLEAFFDFILSADGTILTEDSLVFAQKIKEAENGRVLLKVYNTRSQSTREITIQPRQWAGKGLLGATVRYDRFDASDESQGIRVLEVFPNSPAAHAGLVPYQDFLLGTPTSVFSDLDELVEAVSGSLKQRIQVIVYNADSETVREVVLVPNLEWGGDGCIGCDIGTGLLHRMPPPRRPIGNPAAAALAAAAVANASFTPAVPPLPPSAFRPVPAAVPPPAYTMDPAVAPADAAALPAGLAPIL